MASIISSIFRGSSLLGQAKSLITQNNYSYIGDLVIDASISEIIQYGSTITEHPIENKTSISDHIFKKPMTIKMEGYITNSPLKILGLFDSPLQNNSLNGLIDNIKSSLFSTNNKTSTNQSYLALKSLYEDRNLINIVTKLETFSNMAIQNLTFTNNLNTGGRLLFNIDLVQVIFANVETIHINNTKNKNLYRLTSEPKDMGNISNKVQKSIAAKTYDIINNYWK